MKNNLLLRVADEDDVDDIADLLNTCYRGEGGWTNEANIISGQRISRDDVAVMIEGKKHYFFAFDNFGQLRLRQLEILRLIVRGKSTREIAHGLGLSIKTVEAHRSQIMKRLQIFDVAGLVLFAVREQIISLDD